MIQLKKVYSIFLLLISIVQLQAMVEFNLLENNQTKQKVFLIGQFGDNCVENYTFDKSKAFLQSLNQKSLEKKAPINFIYDYNVGNAEPDYANVSEIINYIHWQFSKEVKNNSYCKLKTCHHRGFERTIISRHIRLLEEIFVDLVNHSINDFKSDARYINHMNSLLQRFYNRDIADMLAVEYINTLEKEEKQFSSMVDDYKKDNQVDIALMFEEKIEKIKEHNKDIQNILNIKSNKDVLLLFALISYLEKFKTSREALDAIDNKLPGALLLGSDAQIGSMIYLRNLLNAKASNSVFIVGAAYLSKILDGLQRLNYNIIKKNCVMNDVNRYGATISWHKEQDDFIEEVINGLVNYQAKENTLISSFAKDLLPKNSNNIKAEKACNICNKTSAEISLKHCGYCKSIWYCSVNCQRADWPKHKVNCNKN
ncbi:MAG: zinc finger MYND domain-containing protein [Candidatus Babeliales bacterium]